MSKLAAGVLAALVLLAGCKHPAKVPAPAKTVAAYASIDSAGGSLVFPVLGGYTAAFVYGPNNAYGARAALTASMGLPAHLPGGPPSATPIVAYTIELDRSTTFAAWHHFISTFSLPVKEVTTGHVFRDYAYDLTQKSSLGYDAGTIVDSQTVTFEGPAAPVTFLAGHKYLLVVTRF